MYCCCSCGIAHPPSDAAITQTTSPQPGILFLQYFLKKDPDSGANALYLTNTIRTNGIVKKQPDETDQARPGDLICSALNADSLEISRLLIENPLRKSFEYSDEQGNLAIKNIEMDSAQFFIRLQLTPDIKWIVVDQYTGPTEPNTRLFSIQPAEL